MATDHSNGIDSAASAFLSDLGGAAPRRASTTDDTGPRETLFENNDELEEDEDEAGPEDGDAGEDGDEEDGEAGEGEDGAEGEEGDDPDDDEGADDEDGDEDEAEGLDLSAEVSVTVDGEEVKVPLKEALDGYIRTETFHKRLNLLNEAKSVIIKQAGEVAQTRQQYIEGLEALTEQLDLIQPKEPDWDALYREDPAGARELETKWKAYKEQRAALEESKTKAKEEQQKEYASNLQQYVQAEEIKLLRAVPEWNDTNTRQKESASMRKTALAVGYTEKELAELYDSRAVLILRKAAAYDRMTANKPKPTKVVGKRPVVTPGAGRPAKATAQRGGDRAMKQLSRTGSVQDAANVFAKFIK
jgi:hypothetical protein